MKGDFRIEEKRSSFFGGIYGGECSVLILANALLIPGPLLF